VCLDVFTRLGVIGSPHPGGDYGRAIRRRGERGTDSAKRRQVRRSVDEAYLDRVRGYHTSQPYRKARRKPQVWVEPLFAEAKD